MKPLVRKRPFLLAGAAFLRIALDEWNYWYGPHVNQPGEPRKVDIEQGAPADLSGTVSVRPLSLTLWRAPVR